MADDKRAKSTLNETSPDTQGMPVPSSNAAEEMNPANDARSLDIGESGQHAPGGYYNQHGVNQSRRVDLDEYTATRPSDEEKS